MAFNSYDIDQANGREPHNQNLDGCVVFQYLVLLFSFSIFRFLFLVIFMSVFV